MGSVGSSSLRSHSLNAASCCSARNSQRLHVRVVRCQTQKQVDSNSSSSIAAGSRRPIEVSRSIAAARAAESSLPDGLFADPFAAQLLDGQQQQQQQQQHEELLDVIATRYIDESLQNAMAATNVNSIQSGDYRQVVIIGDGMDCRPFRLPWPPGTLLFLVAPPEVHEQAEALLAAAGQQDGQQQAHVMRGCLLRRVSMNMAAAAAGDADASSAGPADTAAAAAAAAAAAPGTVFSAQLAHAGFRADRLSVWALQGLHDQGLGKARLQAVLSEVADCAAFHSLLVGELPGPISKRDAENLLAEAGLLGAVFSHQQEGYGRWQQQDSLQENLKEGAEAAGDELAQRWLCTAQQLRLSLEQMGIYEDWATEFADADAGDDFIGNFS
uniref:S-adenosyl-L-methionine-dependent methyltransferase n=1 Tax=Tetradesmus obliquus TaxID=3088 RepID=A0A383WNK8_TETOB|eukprot:jgi/Sobl393_1/5248/SZX79048.1